MSERAHVCLYAGSVVTRAADILLTRRTDCMAWQPAAPFPLARCACSVAVDRQRHQLCLFGGFDGKEVLAKDVFFMDYRIGCTLAQSCVLACHCCG